MTDLLPSADAAVSQAIEKIRNGDVDLDAVLNLVASPAVTPAGTIEYRVAEITPAQRTALTLIPEVFGRVNPTEPRSLTPDEIQTIFEERDVVDTVAKMAADRKDQIRDIVCFHLDREAEEAESVGDAPKDARGHYVLAGRHNVPGTGKAFSREVRQGKATIDLDLLKAQVDDPEVNFSHDDWLACTTQVRVLDENKVMLRLRENPDLMEAIAKATVRGPATASLFVRKAK